MVVAASIKRVMGERAATEVRVVSTESRPQGAAVAAEKGGMLTAIPEWVIRGVQAGVLASGAAPEAEPSRVVPPPSLRYLKDGKLLEMTVVPPTHPLRNLVPVVVAQAR